MSSSPEVIASMRPHLFKLLLVLVAEVVAVCQSGDGDIRKEEGR